MTMTGRCACGAVTYRITDAPLFTQACHCTDCQRSTGSAFVVHLVLAEPDFEIEGKTRMATVPSGSGAGCELHACAKCATYIWVRYLYHKVPVIAVRGGTLDDPAAAPPQAHIFTRSMQPWLTLPDGVPRFDEAFARDDVWPAASCRKYDALPPRA
ncbi:MAG: GFA family protein [Alphaproteobacteria bacterium]